MLSAPPEVATARIGGDSNGAKGAINLLNSAADIGIIFPLVHTATYKYTQVNV
jgi:hypothetical protein